MAFGEMPHEFIASRESVAEMVSGASELRTDEARGIGVALGMADQVAFAFEGLAAQRTRERAFGRGQAGRRLAHFAFARGTQRRRSSRQVDLGGEVGRTWRRAEVG